MKEVKEKIQPGSIILMHPMYDDTGNESQAIEGILKTLLKKVIHLSLLRSLRN
ncbi:hypothetical protein [Lysinibacillus zambalensis]|uniref:hypothetical protein n=1 Tax=Lysinibacillus zambalensis TaxID=3160866 RepID=UPI003D80AF25